MKVAIFNGSPRKEGNTAAILRDVEKRCSESGAEVDYFDLYYLDFKDCSACMGCKKGERCVQKDGLSPALDKIREADAIVIGSPIYMSAETATTKALVDRFYSFLAMGSGQGQYSNRLPKGKKGAVLFTCGNPQGVEMFSPVTARYQNLLQRYEIDGTVVVVPSVTPNMKVLETLRGQKAVADIIERISG
ncbi:MAG TPA: flavodoxin family protein [Methanomassiliicoccales archaeon]|jgi:multimeric flavodoxin WrbA